MHPTRPALPSTSPDPRFQASQLAHEARASRVADRLKTSDELAAETAAQLEELERRRLKRMRQRGSDDDASGDDEDAPKGGYAAKRAKRSNRDADGPGKKARKQTVRSAESLG